MSKEKNAENEKKAENEDILLEFDLTKKKKKKKNKNQISVKKELYSYQTLLDRLYENKVNNNININRKVRLKPPIISNIGSKKSVITNYSEMCNGLNRDYTHLMQYINAETGSECNLDSNSRLIIHGKYTSKSIESILKKYISEYISCKNCKSINTNLTKDSSTRLNFVVCNDCKSSRSVNIIKTGYHAETKADRKNKRKN